MHIDRITHAMQSLEQMDKFLSLTHANFLAKVSIKLAKASNDTNLVIGRLTTFATVLLPMNLVTGLWGKKIALVSRIKKSSSLKNTIFQV